MQRWGRIELDSVDNNKRFDKLNSKIKPKIVPIFNKLQEFIETQTELKSATGSWYINYCFDKRIIFFKIEPVPNSDKPNDEEGIYISICNEDYDYFSLTQLDLQKYVLPKRISHRKHGNWEYQATIKSIEDIDWACRLCGELYNIINNKYYKKK